MVGSNLANSKDCLPSLLIQKAIQTKAGIIPDGINFDQTIHTELSRHEKLSRHEILVQKLTTFQRDLGLDFDKAIPELSVLLLSSQ